MHVARVLDILFDCHDALSELTASPIIASSASERRSQLGTHPCLRLPRVYATYNLLTTCDAGCDFMGCFTSPAARQAANGCLSVLNCSICRIVHSYRTHLAPRDGQIALS